MCIRDRLQSNCSMSIFDQRTAKVLATICAFVAVGAFLYEVRHTLVVILFAVLFAYLLEPVVYRIERSRLARSSRWLAILETYLAIGAILAVFGILFGPKLVEDTRLLSMSLPGLLEKVTTGKIVWQFGNRYGWSYDTQLKIEQFIASHQSEILAWSGQAGTAFAMMLQKLIWIVLVPILAIFFLRDGRQFSATLLHTFSESNQRRFLRLIMTDLDVMLAHFIRAQLILAGISLVVYSVVLTALRFPYALVLGFAAGAMEFIPVVGPLVAALVIVFVGFLTTYPPFVGADPVLCRLAGGAGLLRISASDGRNAGIAPSRSNRGCTYGRRTRWSVGRVPFDPGRCNHPHRLGALAEIFCGHRDSSSTRIRRQCP